MGEPLPADVPPDDAAASNETAAQEEKPRGELRRLRVPTSVVVTLIVAALSVWVAPAFTRQWDDRQKARELRVAIAEDIITKGTRVIYGATRPPLPGYEPAADYELMLRQWIEEGAVLDAKLRAYFPKEISDRWHRFDQQYMQPLLRVVNALPAAYKRHLGETRPELIDQFTYRWRSNTAFESEFPDVVLVEDVKTIAKTARVITKQTPLSDISDKEWIDWLARAVASPNAESPIFASLRTSFRNIGVAELSALTDQLLAAHLTGFSTTRGDFLHDLLP